MEAITPNRKKTMRKELASLRAQISDFFKQARACRERLALTRRLIDKEDAEGWVARGMEWREMFWKRRLAVYVNSPVKKYANISPSAAARAEARHRINYGA